MTLPQVVLADPPPPTAAVPDRASKANVLFIDDDHRVLDALRRALRAEPLNIFRAENGVAALEILARHPIQVVMTDIRMPNMDGLSLLKTVARDYPDTIRLVLSGNVCIDVVIQAIKDGSIYRYVLKPWENEDLKITIRQALSVWYLEVERRQMLNLLHQQNEQLEAHVAQRTQQLYTYAHQADIGRHAAQIVHNLNSPLQALTGAIDLLTLYHQNGSSQPEDMHRGITLARKSASDLKSIIAGVLAYARRESHTPYRSVDLNQLVEERLKFFEMLPAFKRGVDISVRLDRKLPAITGNAIDIKQVLDNLIKNALDAMGHAPRKQLIIETRRQAEYCVISVTDSGEGIRPDHCHRIFDPDFTTKPVGKGSGLGLASVKTMVDAYDGRIEFESLEGQGTTFRVYWPACQKESCRKINIREKGNTA